MLSHLLASWCHSLHLFLMVSLLAQVLFLVVSLLAQHVFLVGSCLAMRNTCFPRGNIREEAMIKKQEEKDEKAKHHHVIRICPQKIIWKHNEQISDTQTISHAFILCAKLVPHGLTRCTQLISYDSTYCTTLVLHGRPSCTQICFS